MNRASSGVAPADPGVETLRHQLFRYAQDLQELMDQQRQLQQNYQMVLKSLGREVPENDLLAKVLIETSPLHIVTDTLGRVLRQSENVNATLGLSGHTLVGESISAALAPDQLNGFQTVIAKFAGSAGLGGIEQRRLKLGHAAQSPGLGQFDVLTLQVRNGGGQNELYWLMRPAGKSSAMEVQGAFASACSTDIGVFTTDPSGTICTVNEALTRMTGFRSAEVLGQNPRLLGSGRHENAFFQEFFLALLDTGSWNGQILNRKKNGQIFLTWQSVKIVEDEYGNVTSYMAAVADLSLTNRGSTQISPDAYLNSVTGLANRRSLESYFCQALEQAHTDGTILRSLFLSVDGLSRIGEELGYFALDQARREVGLRLQAIERPDLRIADIDGGNFVLLIQSPMTESELAEFALSTSNRLEAPLQIGQQQVTVKIYIGCASYPKDGRDMGTLLRHADAALYGAKKFDTPFCVYESEFNAPSPCATDS